MIEHTTSQINMAKNKLDYTENQIKGFNEIDYDTQLRELNNKLIELREKVENQKIEGKNKRQSQKL